MFALAIWSGRDRRLVLARDRMGIKPLYIRRAGRDIVFGSELKALFAHPRVTRRLDRAALQDFLSLNYVPEPAHAGRRDRESCPPATIWNGGTASRTVTAYWKLSHAPDASIGEEAAAEELDGLLREVRAGATGERCSARRLGQRGPRFLHFAALRRGTGLAARSRRFPSRSNRSPATKASGFGDIARRYGTEHHEFELNRELGSGFRDRRLRVVFR